MEQIIIHHGHEYIHLNLGITDERADELEKILQNELIRKAVDNNIVIIDEENGTVELSAARVMDFLINKVAKTTQEQLFMMMHVESLTKVIDQHITAFSGGKLSADND
jgi:nucleoside-triphosphatase THEP1